MATMSEMSVLIKYSLVWCQWHPRILAFFPSLLPSGTEMPLKPRAQALLSTGREISSGRRKIKLSCFLNSSEAETGERPQVLHSLSSLHLEGSIVSREEMSLIDMVYKEFWLWNSGYSSLCSILLSTWAL